MKPLKKQVEFKQVNSGYHIMTCDLDQKKTKKIGDVTLFMLPERESDHRVAHPDIGTVIQSDKFPKGTKVMTSHFSFTDGEHKSQQFGTDDSGNPLFLVEDLMTYFIIDDNEEHPIPVEGVLLCEAIEGKFVDTFLELDVEHSGKRRDVVKVIAPWEGCTEFKKGDYIYLNIGGDYQFQYNGKDYIRVDYRRNRVLMRLNSPEWRDVNVRKHVKRNINYGNE